MLFVTNEASVELQGDVLTHTSPRCVFPPPPLPSLPLGTRPTYYLLLLFSELYKGPLRLWPFDGVERRVAGDFLDKKKKKKSRRRRGVRLKGGINGLVMKLPNENIKARLQMIIKKRRWVDEENVKKRKNVLSQNKHGIKNELLIYLHINR